MTDDRIEAGNWRPQLIDYRYLSLTNAAPFSPSDTLPLTPRAKRLMGVQSVVSLVRIGLIVSRAVNTSSVSGGGRCEPSGRRMSCPPS